jgi:RNA polymerase sigma factor (sigma-70 family)
MRDDPSVVALVSRVGDGDQDAWNELIERYAPLVWSICARCLLSREDIDDAAQSVWLLLVENIGSLREPAALPGWLATTTRRECLRILGAAHRREREGLEEQMPPGLADTTQQEIIAAERNTVLRAAFDELQRGCRELLSMLMTDPPRSYAEISATLGIPVGSIGPTRARCLAQLRRSRHISSVLDDHAGDIDIKEAEG